RHSEVGMVQRIEELRPELSIKSFSQREFFRQVEVEVGQARASHYAYARVAENLVGYEAGRPRRCAQRHECAGIEPAVHGAPVIRQVSIGNSVGPAPSLAADVYGLRLIDG